MQAELSTSQSDNAESSVLSELVDVKDENNFGKDLTSSELTALLKSWLCKAVLAENRINVDYLFYVAEHHNKHPVDWLRTQLRKYKQIQMLNEEDRQLAIKRFLDRQ